ncbi:MAG: hypothetical protein ABR977_02775 [Candidatus Dormibacteria bacterium]|jgi:hypothetical protein
MSHRITLPSLLAGLIAVAALAACGSTTAPSSSSSAPGGATATPASGATATPAPTVASIDASACPSASSIGSALGVTLPTPTVINPGASASALPSGAVGIACEYLGLTASPPVVVIVALGAGVPTSWFTTQEQEQIASEQKDGLDISFTPLSGLGDEAATYTYTASGATVEGVLAIQSGNFAGVFTDGTTASLSQVESLVRSLLG